MGFAMAREDATDRRARGDRPPGADIVMCTSDRAGGPSYAVCELSYDDRMKSKSQQRSDSRSRSSAARRNKMMRSMLALGTRVR